jgi:GMP synthase (glutamine-hydrolysing)
MAGDLADRLRYLLLQVRNPDDPMREHEVVCFARALGCAEDRITARDLLQGCPAPAELGEVDLVLLGGSGDYSVVSGGPWLAESLEAMRELVELRKPTFASCWGFQAMALALGGEVVTDLSRAEVGTRHVRLTEAGRADPIFADLYDPARPDGTFLAQMGHQDIVDRLPAGATRLASSDRVENEAFRIEGAPIYCTQFHPELDRTTLLDRLHRYPSYVERIEGVPYQVFELTCVAESPRTDRLLRRFIEHVFG